MFSLNSQSFTVITLGAAQEEINYRNTDPTFTIVDVDNSYGNKIIFKIDMNQDNAIVWWHICLNNSMPAYSHEQIAAKLPSF